MTTAGTVRRALRGSWAALLLVALAACGGDGSEDERPPVAGRDTQPEGARVGEHWHAAFGIQACGKLLPPVADVNPDRSGLHSHRDGLIHIHPFTNRYAGDGANLGAFFDTAGIELDDGTLRTPKDELDTSDGCDGSPAEIRLFVDGTEYEGDINGFRPQDGQVLQLLFDAPDAAPLDLPWADEVRSPADVQALAGLPGGGGPAS